MKQFVYFYSILLLATILSGCGNDNIEYGEYFGKQVAYRNDFLCCKYVPDTLKQTLVFEQENEPFTKPIKLGLFETTNDEKTGEETERPLGKEIELFVNGKAQNGSNFEVKPGTKELELGIVFNREQLEKKRNGERDYYWTLKVLDAGDLDMVNENLTSGKIPVLLTWKAEYATTMNPLVKGIICIVIFIVSLLVLWFVLLRWIVFPRFAFGNLQVMYFEGDSRLGMESCSLHGARKIICSEKPKYQSKLNKLFCGRIEYLTNSFWIKEVEMSPCGSDGIAVNENFKANEAITYRMAAMITAQNGPKTPFVAKLAKTEKVAKISIN